MRTEDQIKEQLKRIREQKLTTPGCKAQNFWRGVREALIWVKEQPDDDFLA